MSDGGTTESPATTSSGPGGRLVQVLCIGLSAFQIIVTYALPLNPLLHYAIFVSVVSVLIFDQIYQYHTAGYASALALILFVAILMLTVAQNRLLGRRVFYGD